MRTTDLQRRRFLQMGGMAGLGALLAACGGSPAAPAPTAGAGPAPTTGEAAPTAAQAAAAGGAVTLNVLWENWGDIYNNLMTAIGGQFTKDNPGVAVEWNFDPDWVTKLTTLIAAKTLPDVTIMRSAPVYTMAAKGTLTSLDDMVKQAGVKREDFITPLWDSAVVDGKLYALPGGADYWCMFYSKDIYKEVGLEKPPQTFDELLAHSKQILKLTSGGDIDRIGYNPQAGHFQNWAYINGGSFVDAANGKITANHPANVEMLDRLAAYVKALDVNKLAAFNQRPGTFEAGNPFATKQSAYIFDGFWTYDALDQHAPDIDYAIDFWPTIKGTEQERANYMMGGWQVSLPAGTAHGDDAWKFVKYAFIDKSADMGVSTLNGTCVIAQLPAWEKGVRDKLGASNRMSSYLNKFTETAAAAKNFFPVSPVQSYYNDELNRVYDLVMRGQMTAQQGLDEVTKNVQAEYDKTRQG